MVCINYCQWYILFDGRIRLDAKSLGERSLLSTINCAVSDTSDG